MSNRITIQSIKILNFRSIRNETVVANDMNIFVGLNDIGKSNFLKALNLFFNGQTDYDIDFDFEHDFSFYFPQSSHQAKQICIEIKFSVPDTYKNAGVYTWKKVWKAAKYFDEKITDANGNAPSERSRIPSTLRRIRYRYVPAVKSREYYKSLLGELYSTVSTVINSPLEDSVGRFTNVLQDYTRQIAQEVRTKVGIQSAIDFPEDLKEIFKNLVFNTAAGASENTDKVVTLDKRGDGIQARHIPIILKYIADEDQKTRSQGSMQVHTIWGYEEPENGIELAMAYDLAQNFVEYSSDIQMFITSHSPAFYMLSKNEKCNVLYVTQNRSDSEEGTKAADNIDHLIIGENMGLLPVVSPYIEDQRKKYDEYRRLILEETLADVDTIFVEGKTDIEYLKLAIQCFSHGLSERLNTKKLRLFSKSEEGGCAIIEDLVCAWILSRNKSRCIALFDKDQAGIKAKSSTSNNPIYQKAKKKPCLQLLKPSGEILSFHQKYKESNIAYEIEHLLSPACWKEMESKGWTSPRSADELYEIAKPKMDVNTTINAALLELSPSQDFADTIMKLIPNDKKKVQICSFVKQEVTAGHQDYIEGLIPTIEWLEGFFIKNNVEK